MQTLAIILYSLWIFIKTMLKVLWPIFLVLLIFTIVRMIYYHKKYGYDYFAIFKKRKVIDSKKEMLLRMLEKQRFKSIIVEDERYYSSVIALTEFGICTFQIFPYTQVTIEGNKKDLELTYYVSKGKKNQIKNPYLLQEEDQQKIAMKLPGVPIYSYVVFDNTSLLLLEGDSKIETLKIQSYYYHLETMNKNKEHLYQVAELEEMKRKLKE